MPFASLVLKAKDGLKRPSFIRKLCPSVTELEGTGAGRSSSDTHNSHVACQFVPDNTIASSGGFQNAYFTVFLISHSVVGCAGQLPHPERSNDSLEDPSPTHQVTSLRQRFLSALQALFRFPFDPLRIHNPCILLLRCLSFPILLHLPSYYASQASTVLHYAEQAQGDYDTWSSVLASGDVTHAAIPVWNATSPIQSIPPCRPSASRRTSTLLPFYSSESEIREPPRSQPSAMPASVDQLQRAWTLFVDSRIVDWTILTTIACTLIGASPTILQIPGASDSDITFSMIFLALFRAIAATLYGSILIFSFRNAQRKSVHFAMSWYQRTKKSQHTAFCAAWIVLALPAISLCWATIFYVFAIISFVWHDELGTDISSASNTLQLSLISIAPTVLRCVITVASMLDMACIAWILLTLRVYGSGQDRGLENP
ncbi:hypothetical protein Hypma_003730 [Hypsizygus marmoreus]|uniref:Uncharacterized protein n=1 Tax=Hypsizygus marmoreus TaxID=39966 RepID=A0A369JAF2_HYPMA|nr:hypothetical protein Hypma_003730 [Hypsizygus marmoreus]